MRFDSDNAEGIETPLGLVGAVADDEMITSHRQVAHIIAHLSVGVGRGLFAKQDGVLCVADGYRAIVHVVVEIHIKRFPKIACLDVGSFHVAVHQRAFDVDFVLVADKRVIGRHFVARNGHERDDGGNEKY